MKQTLSLLLFFSVGIHKIVDTTDEDSNEPKNEFINHGFVFVNKTDIGIVIILVDSFLIKYKLYYPEKDRKLVRDGIIFFNNESKFNKLSIIASKNCVKNVTDEIDDAIKVIEINLKIEMMSNAKYTKIDEILKQIVSNLKAKDSVLKQLEFMTILDDIITEYKDKLHTECGNIIENWIKIKRNEFKNSKINDSDYFVTSYIKQVEEKFDESVMEISKQIST